MQQRKTRAIGKWHGLRNDIQQAFSRPHTSAKQARAALRWTVDPNLNVTRFEVLQ
jgi:hypothetical protein